jgi:hypothetical protein
MHCLSNTACLSSNWQQLAAACYAVLCHAVLCLIGICYAVLVLLFRPFLRLLLLLPLSAACSLAGKEQPALIEQLELHNICCSLLLHTAASVLQAHLPSSWWLGCR